MGSGPEQVRQEGSQGRQAGEVDVVDGSEKKFGGQSQVEVVRARVRGAAHERQCVESGPEHVRHVGWQAVQTPAYSMRVGGQTQAPEGARTKVGLHERQSVRVVARQVRHDGWQRRDSHSLDVGE